MIRIDTASGFALPDGALDLPKDLKVGNINDWTDYGIWGLLFFDEQPPWFAFIECMQILFHRQQSCPELLFNPPSNNFKGELEHEFISYKVPLNWNLRHLLFRDLETVRYGVPSSLSRIEQWNRLFGQMKKSINVDLSYLQYNFEDVVSLRRALDLLRSTEVEAYSSKRWTSRHLLPLGPDMLFADVKERDQKGDRHFMRRTGEMLYLMLGRSKPEFREELSQLLHDRLLSKDLIWNKLARLIQQPMNDNPSSNGRFVEFSTGYLPFPYLPKYDELARDWISLLSLRRIQTEDIMDSLMRLSALHIVIYMIYRAQVTIGLPGEEYPPFVFDLSCSARKNPVQKMALGQYGSHIRRPREAIDAYIDAFAESTYWKDVTESVMGTRNAVTVLNEMFRWDEGEMLDDDSTTEECLAKFRDSALANTKHSIWAAIAIHTRRAGMVLAQQGAGTWYAPNDAFLEALVLANVEDPIEMGEFLRRLFLRYRIVIGQEQAYKAFEGETTSLEKLKTNEQRLEERLRILGYIDRKSDACAFVVNPFYYQTDGKSMEAA